EVGEWTGESVHGGGHSATHGGFPALGGGEFARSAHDLGGFGVQGASVSARCRIPHGMALQHRGARGWGGIRSRWYSAHGTCFVDRIGMVHPCAQAQGAGPTQHRAGRVRPVCCWAPEVKTSCADMCREQLAKTREKGLSTSRKRLPHHLFTGWFPRGVRCGQQRSGVLGESDTQLLAVEL